MDLSPTKIADLSESELRELVRNAEQALNQRLAERARGTLKEIRKRAAEVGYQVTFTKLGTAPGGKAAAASPAPRKKAAAKYRNPADSAETWAGRGRPPKWVQVALAEGQSLEDLAVSPEGAAA